MGCGRAGPGCSRHRAVMNRARFWTRFGRFRSRRIGPVTHGPEVRYRRNNHLLPPLGRSTPEIMLNKRGLCRRPLGTFTLQISARSHVQGLDVGDRLAGRPPPKKRC